MADLDQQALTYAWMRYVRMSMTQAIGREDFGEIIQAYLAAAGDDHSLATSGLSSEAFVRKLRDEWRDPGDDQ